MGEQGQKLKLNAVQLSTLMGSLYNDTSYLIPAPSMNQKKERCGQVTQVEVKCSVKI